MKPKYFVITDVLKSSLDDFQLDIFISFYFFISFVIRLKNMTDCTFIYFPIRGRAEADRIALNLAGVKYIEENVHKDKWVDEKKKLLADGLLPFGQIPILEHKGKALVESMTILRYIGREYIYICII